MPPSLLSVFLLEAKPRPAVARRTDVSGLVANAPAWDAWVTHYDGDDVWARSSAGSSWDLAAGPAGVLVARRREARDNLGDIAFLPCMGRWEGVSTVLRLERRVDPEELDAMQAALDALGKPEKAR